MARRRLWRNDVVRSYWRTRHPLLRFLCLHEAATSPFVVAISYPSNNFAIIHLHFGDCLCGTLFSSRWSAMEFRRCMPPCTRFIAREDPHSKCILCLGFSHAREAVYGTSNCEICDDFRLITLRSRLEDYERESSKFSRRASSTNAPPREIAASREAAASRRAASWGSDVELEEMESEQTGLAFSLPPSSERARANSPVEFLPDFQFPSPKARDFVSFGLDDILHTAASDSEDFGPALADALPPSSQEARPSAAYSELVDVLSRATEKLALDWPDEPRESRASKLDDRFLIGAHSKLERRKLPFFSDLHREISSSWKQPFSSRLTNATAADFTNLVGSVEQGYTAMPVIEDTLASHLSPSLAPSWKSRPLLPSKPCRTTSALIGKSYIAAGQAGMALHTMAILQAYQADVLKEMDEGTGLTPEAVKELRRATDLALRATKHTARAVGRSMAASVAAERHLWLNLTEIREREKTFLMDAPISQSGLFGEAVSAVVDKFRSAKTQSAALNQFMPRRARDFSTPSSSVSREQPPPRREPPSGGAQATRLPPTTVWGARGRSSSRQQPRKRVNMKRPNKPAASANPGRSWPPGRNEESRFTVTGRGQTAKAFLPAPNALSSLKSVTTTLRGLVCRSNSPSFSLGLAVGGRVHLSPFAARPLAAGEPHVRRHSCFSPAVYGTRAGHPSAQHFSLRHPEQGRRGLSFTVVGAAASRPSRHPISGMSSLARHYDSSVTLPSRMGAFTRGIAVGSPHNSNRLHSSVWEKSPPFRRGSPDSSKQRRQGFCSTTGTFLPPAERSNRGSTAVGSRTRFLQPLLPRSKEGRRLEAYPGSTAFESFPLQREVQNADDENHHVSGSGGRLVCHHRPEGCVFSHPGRSQSGGKAYQYKVLPFGLALAPRTFTKCMDAALAPLRLQGIRVLNYLDDRLILAHSRELVSRHRDIVLGHIHSLGLRMNAKKSVLLPSQRTVFLGVHLDSVQMQARLAPARIPVFTACLARFKLDHHVSVATCRRLLGLMAAASPVLPLGLLHMRPFLWWMKELRLHPTVPATRLVRVSRSCCRHLLMWRDPVFLRSGVRMGAIHRRHMITTDASMTGWGAVFEGRPASGEWKEEFLFWHINCLELRAVFLALKYFLPVLGEHHVIVRTDNMAVVSHINRQGGSRSRTLDRLARHLLLWSQDKFLSLRAVHVPGVLNLAADFLSRQKLKPGEWMLNRQTVSQIWDLFGKAEMDLFASQESSQCPLWFSQSFPTTLGIDAFAHPWPNVSLYAFPPIKLIPAVLCRVKVSGARLLLIAPFWPSQTWFSELTPLLYRPPWEIPIRRDLLSQLQGKIWHPQPELWKLWVWPIQGQGL